MGASFTRLSFLYAKDLWGHIDGSVPLNQGLVGVALAAARARRREQA